MTGGGPKTVAAVAPAIGLALIVAAVLTRTNEPLMRANSLDQVVTQVRTGFGDDRIARVRDHGSTLAVTLAAPAPGGRNAPLKGQFEGQILAAAVAEWMRSTGREPITTFITADSRGDHLTNDTFGDPVPSTSGISSLRPGECESVAAASVRPPLTLASARTLPYLHGTCVFLFRTSEPLPGSTEAASVLGHMAGALGDVDKRPYYFELDDEQGRPQDAASWMPGVNGSTWARPGLSYAMAHG